MKSQAIKRLSKGLKKHTSGEKLPNKRVFVGLSGGVDSSVSAALLKEAGYDVTGVFIKVWQPDWIECTWKEERRDAMRVAAHLDIPFVTLDLEKEYKRDVADYMIAEYRAGRTPNPDVMCNKAVKFGGFYDWAMKEGADYVATGHYSQIHSSKSGMGYSLKMGIDQNKDQSYFLWNIRAEQLGHILFPIGHLTKPEVRKLAAKFKLPTAEKKDSQGICFIGMVDMKEFLAHYIEAKPGDVIDETGKVIGKHSGAVFSTIGERHGFTIHEKGTQDKPRFVIAKDVEMNTITVSESKHGTHSPEKITSPVSVRIEKTNWPGSIPSVGTEYTARARYRQKLETVIFASIDLAAQTAEVRFEHAPEAMTPGQSLVIYDGDTCIGGGIIE
ncbi:MAG: tRNA 2-thiouridine(34) synthase MnmA [Candidatus Pacebacteria bacterium]|nr:tRNA 2-thiouridine(34) synthase MnmA [Candidatus Paceibacterota bacterium]